MNNLTKRVLTSIVLILLLILGILNDLIWLFLLIIISLVLLIEFKNLVNKIWKSNFVKKNLINFLFILYLITFVYLVNSTNKNYVLIILSVCIFSDIGGYICGKLIGGKKLTKLSPNKTISGSIGSFIFSLFPITYLIYYYEYLLNNEFDYLKICVLFFLISLICQLGDLFISYFKRRSNVKDTGEILPGHGGLLDRLDGIIFAVPFGILMNNILSYL